MIILAGILGEILNTFVAMAPYLLLGLTFAGILHITFTRAFVIKHLGGSNASSIIKAALLGVPLPLCSCGVLPTAISLRKNNASEGATMSFLISTPQTGVDSMVATWGMLGPVFAVFRPVAAFLMGIAGGLIINLFGVDRKAGPRTASESLDCPMCYLKTPHKHGFRDMLSGMVKYAYSEFLDDISMHLVIGIIISGLIAFFLPADFFSRYAGNTFVEMLIMIAGGIPLYVCATASIPIAMTLMMKGLSPGAAFVFLAVGPATNAASIMLIANAMGKRFIVIYLATISVFSVIAGYALNFTVGFFDVKMSHVHKMHDHSGHGIVTWAMFFSAIFLVMLLFSFYRKYALKYARRLLPLKNVANSSGSGIREFVLTVNGMTCSRCAANVSQSLYRVAGVGEVAVDVPGKKVTVSASCSIGDIKDAVGKAGYEVVG
jgi:uncharacterized membrane protein YraQ (UPF0718 family)/copper chaperone CopZ